MSSLNDAYRFTIADGIVTAVFEYDDGIWKQESIEPDETYALDPSDNRVVIKTEVEQTETSTERYLTLDGGQTYYELDDDSDEGESDDGDSDDSDSEVEDDDLYRFQFDPSSNIVGASKFDDGVWQQVRFDANESYKVDAVLGVQRVIKTEVERGVTKTEIYEDLDGDGNYVELDSAGKSENGFYVGSAGVDVASGGAGADELYGNGGDDDLYGDDGEDDLFGDDGNDDLYGGNSADELYGGMGNDSLRGDAGDDDLRGNQGNDDLNGGDGNDDLYGGASTDKLYGGIGNDSLKGETGDDDLRGNQGSDDLIGGDGNDELQGGVGTDKLTGGIGQDRLTGGLDADTFLFTSRADSSVGARRDVIVDFNGTQRDLLNLAGIDANERTSGNQAFTWLGTRAFSGVAGQLRYFTASSPSGIVVQGDVNGDRTADFEVSLLGVSSLSTSQVVL